MEKSNILKIISLFLLTLVVSLLACACSPEDCTNSMNNNPYYISNAAPGTTPVIESDC